MHTILTLVDFTETSLKALEQAISLGKVYQSRIALCHITSERKLDQAIERMQEYVDRVEQGGLAASVEMGIGDLFVEAPKIIRLLGVKMVVVGTHGKKGIQHVIGSRIYKLLQLINVPTIVVSEHTEVIQSPLKCIVLPVAPHSNYLQLIEEGAKLLQVGGKLVMLAIHKPGVALSREILENLEKAKSMLERNDILFEIEEVDSQFFSVGYAKETLQLLDRFEAEMIGIMTDVSDQGSLYGMMDKENVLFNSKGIPVLCFTKQ